MADDNRPWERDVVDGYAVLDTGATNHVRPPWNWETPDILEMYPEVPVRLVIGGAFFRRSPGGSLVGRPDCTLIVSVSQLLGYGWRLNGFPAPEPQEGPSSLTRDDWHVPVELSDGLIVISTV